MKKSNSIKTSSSKKLNIKPIRIAMSTYEKANDILFKVNENKKGRRKVKLDALFILALEGVTESDVEKLKKQSLSSEDRKEQLRAKYISSRGQISKEEFTDFMMTCEYIGFLQEQSPLAQEISLSK